MFLTAQRYASMVYPVVVRLSVCRSDRQSQANTVPKWLIETSYDSAETPYE